MEWQSIGHGFGLHGENLTGMLCIGRYYIDTGENDTGAWLLHDKQLFIAQNDKRKKQNKCRSFDSLHSLRMTDSI